MLHGADLVAYSVTKYLAGHSDLVAGAVAGRSDLMATVLKLRGLLGTQLDPHSAWLISRSLETLSLRMQRANDSARIIAEHLRDHPKVEDINYLGFLKPGTREAEIFAKQCDQRRLDLRLHHQGRAGGGVPFPQPHPAHQAGGQPGRHGIADLPSGLDHPFRHQGGGTRGARHHRRHASGFRSGSRIRRDLIADIEEAMGARRAQIVMRGLTESEFGDGGRVHGARRRTRRWTRTGAQVSCRRLPRV